MIRVAVVDNHEVVREGVVSRFAATEQMTVVLAGGTVEEVTTSSAGVDVVILDLWLAEGDSIGGIDALVARGAKVLLYTSEERPVPLRRAIEAGASGLLLKSDPLDAVVAGIEAAMDGEFCCSGTLAHALLTDDGLVAELSARQVEILQALADGLDYRSTARLLNISEGSVKTQLARVREKFRRNGIEPMNSTDMIRLARRQGDLTD